MNKIYITNNIVESIHGKINYYLPKHITNAYNFLDCINPLTTSLEEFFLLIYLNLTTMYQYMREDKGLIKFF